MSRLHICFDYFVFDKHSFSSIIAPNLMHKLLYTSRYQSEQRSAVTSENCCGIVHLHVRHWRSGVATLFNVVRIIRVSHLFVCSFLPRLNCGVRQVNHASQTSNFLTPKIGYIQQNSTTYDMSTILGLLSFSTR